jgi:UDP-N-acetylglucosamine transferase subunit ALG13
LKRGYNILICPLEWGLGHAARMIPVARKLQEMNNNIFIGSGEEHLSLFRNELPGVSYIKFPGFKPSYSRYIPQYLALLLRTPLLLYHIMLEHFRLKGIIRENAIDIVISDNRFGLWNRDVTTAYVTHMPLIPFPKMFRFLEFAGVFLHGIIIKKYTLCFIPDLPGEVNISGRLSHGIKIPGNTRYIGILSRFNTTEPTQKENPVQFQHNTVILSGPEPQREILKQKLIAVLKHEKPITVILEGKPGNTNETAKCGNIIIYNHLPASEMREIISGSKLIITRSGYSTIMELISLNCNALLIPTPGQTEQEYLAEYLSEKGWFLTISQSALKSGISFPSYKTNVHSEIIDQSFDLLTAALNELLENLH